MRAGPCWHGPWCSGTGPECDLDEALGPAGAWPETLRRIAALNEEPDQ